MKLDTRDMIEELNRLDGITKSQQKELDKAVRVVDSQQREILHLRGINQSNMLYLIDICKENRVLKEKLNKKCTCNKPEMKPEIEQAKNEEINHG